MRESKDIPSTILDDDIPSPVIPIPDILDSHEAQRLLGLGYYGLKNSEWYLMKDDMHYPGASYIVLGKIYDRDKSCSLNMRRKLLKHAKIKQAAQDAQRIELLQYKHSAVIRKLANVKGYIAKKHLEFSSSNFRELIELFNDKGVLVENISEALEAVEILERQRKT